MQIAVVRFRFLSALASSGLQSSMKRTRSRISGIPRNGSGNEARVGPPTQGAGRSTSATSPDAWKTGSPGKSIEGLISGQAFPPQVLLRR